LQDRYSHFLIKKSDLESLGTENFCKAAEICL
jgi:hypothetical protein